MKVQKTICIDVELLEKLQKENNASGLINDLLINYFNAPGSYFEKKYKQIKEAEAKLKEEAEAWLKQDNPLNKPSP